MIRKRKTRQKRGLRLWFINNILRIIILSNIFVALLLLLSYMATMVSPATFHYLAFIGLSYPILLSINFVFAVFWLLVKSKRALISTVSILLGWNILASFFVMNRSNQESEVTEFQTKVLSYNVRVFNRWNWLKDANQGVNAINFIKKMKADIVCLQEFYSSTSIGTNAVDSLTSDSSLVNMHISYNKSNSKHFNDGIATFTKYEIINKGKISNSFNSNFCIYTDLLIDSTIVRVYNIHLASVHLGYDDYDLIKNINHTDTIDVAGYRSIYHKMRKGYIKRAKQADLISESIRKCKYPVIICGDFNDTPVSYVYTKLSKDLDDAFCKSGTGVGSTYVNSYFPFRIDFILHSKNIKSFAYKKEDVAFSDHYPIQCVLEVSDDET